MSCAKATAGRLCAGAEGDKSISERQEENQAVTQKSSQYVQEGGSTDPNLLTWDLPHRGKKHAYLTLSQQYELILIKDYIRV